MKRLIPILLLIVVLAILSTGILGCASVAGDGASVHGKRLNPVHTRCATSDTPDASCRATCEQDLKHQRKNRMRDIEDGRLHSLEQNA